MGCGGSRIIEEYLEKNKEKNLGKPSDLDKVIEYLERHADSKIKELKKVQYTELSKGPNVGKAQQWIVEAIYWNGKKPSETHSVWLADNGMYEIQLGQFIA